MKILILNKKSLEKDIFDRQAMLKVCIVVPDRIIAMSSKNMENIDKERDDHGIS